MSEYTLTLLDTVGIQEYIFGSNVLRENIGASELVRRATRLWPFELLQTMGQTNVRPDVIPTGDPEDLNEKEIDRDNLSAEVVYAGGGNCVILFTHRESAENFVTALSLRLVAEAPDLDLVTVHEQVNWKTDSLTDKVRVALEELNKKKLNRRVSTPLLGLSTTVACRSTGLPAVGTDADEPGLKPKAAAPRPLSASILAKLGMTENANERLKQLLPELKKREVNLSIPYDFDNFGREAGEISYIAVVHADGNGMGKQIQELWKHFPNPEQNRAYIQAMREFSKTIENVSRHALQALGDLLLRHWSAQTQIVGQAQYEGTWHEVNQVNLAWDDENSRPYVPFRPMVFGGDDLTFVTDGRLGLTLTAAYLDLFESAMQAEKDTVAAQYVQPLKACAGVAVVKAHYPFSRAYTLSEELCRNAKRVWERKVSALDWHFAATGLLGDLKDIRLRQYRVPAGRLETRPVSLKLQPDSWRSWPAFVRVAKQFLVGDEWADKRNKVIALRQALRDGTDAVLKFRNTFRLDKLPMLDGAAPMQTTGWSEGGEPHCGYFDAIEALDFFLPLER